VTLADQDCEPLDKGSEDGSAILGLAISGSAPYSSRLHDLGCAFSHGGLFYWERLMAFAYFLMAAGGLLTLAGWIAIAITRNAQHSTARI